MMKVQVIDSIPFANRVCPDLRDPRELDAWLRPQLKFKNDPKGVEYLQTMQTLFKQRGQGDCDCFVITTLACAIVNGWDDLHINLVGYDKKAPVHIYTDITWNGKRCILDFTNPRYDQERKHGKFGAYKFRQRVPVRWREWKFN
jgi:hypothetical protein